MVRISDFYAHSLSHLRSALPVLEGLFAIRPENTSIATAIPGLGVCKSTYCKPERRGAPETGQLSLR